MNSVLYSFLTFIVTFVVVLILFFIVNKFKKNKDNINKTEIDYLVKRYKIDKNKIGVKKLVITTTILDSFIIALIVSVVSYIPGLFVELIVGFLLVLILIFIGYELLGIYYVKKGYSKKGRK